MTFERLKSINSFFKFIWFRVCGHGPGPLEKQWVGSINTLLFRLFVFK